MLAVILRRLPERRQSYSWCCRGGTCCFQSCVNAGKRSFGIYFLMHPPHGFVHCKETLDAECPPGMSSPEAAAAHQGRLMSGVLQNQYCMFPDTSLL